MTYGIRASLLCLAVACSAPAAAQAAASPYPNRAPIAEYMMESAAEIALARSAAPPSISAKAEILVLGPHGYTSAVKGTNGFVCLVERSWDGDFVDPMFWNPRGRGPDCLNPPAARTVLPHMRDRAKWALEGLSIAQMRQRTEAAVAAKTYVMPEPGAMAYMLSKQQYLSDDAHAWHPHLMFFLATSDAEMGSNLPGSPVFHPYSPAPELFTTYLVAVRKWSDGTDSMMK